MVQNHGGVHSKVCAATGSVSDSSAPAAKQRFDKAPSDSNSSRGENVLDARRAQAKVGSDAAPDLQDQATETSERKTVFIR